MPSIIMTRAANTSALAFLGSLASAMIIAPADSDANIIRAVASTGTDGTVRHLAEADVAVGRLGADRRVRLVDNDLAVGAPDAELRGHLADPRVPVGVLHRCRAVDAGHPHGSRTGLGAGVTADRSHGDVAISRLELHRVSALVDANIAHAGGHVDLPEAPGGVEPGHP